MMRARTPLAGRRPGAWVAALLALPLLGGGCTKDTNYTYVDVDVTVDEPTINNSLLYLVTSCEFVVMGVDENPQVFGLPCRENNVPRHVGTFQWTSTATSGTLQFKVTLFNANHDPIGDGTSDPVAVSPGKHLATSVLIVGNDNTPPIVDAGTGNDAATTADAGDAAAGDAAAGDTPLDQNVDGGAADTAADDAAAMGG